MEKDIILNMKMPLLSATLKAISKHATELANELDIINNTLCPKCGDKLKPKKKFAKGGVIYCTCPRCEYTGFHKVEFFIDFYKKELLH